MTALRTSKTITTHIQQLRECRLCKDMESCPIVGQPVLSPVMLVGQAPGVHEERLEKPFAWTAGKTLFKWLKTCGIEEEQARQKIYFAAVCRCFPGKNPKGGDRVPSPTEIENCSTWLDSELSLIKPKLVIAIGKLAISQFYPVKKLDQIVGQKLKLSRASQAFNFLPLPHPSGASTWHRSSPGKELLESALKKLSRDQSFRSLLT